MPLIFRGINKTRWNQQKHQDEYNWLKAGEIPAETLTDVVRKDIQQNELSVYLIDDNDDALDRMVAAFAANRDRPDKLDFKVIDYQVLVDAGFTFKKSLGDTSDVSVNQCHRDLYPLTTSRLMEFIQMLYFKTESGRKTKKDVEKLIIKSIQSGYIDERSIRSPNMLSKIEILKRKYT